jgi:hypothetical protein
MTTPPNDLEKINAELAELEQKKLELEKVKQDASTTEQSHITSSRPPGEPTDEELSRRIKATVPFMCLLPPIGIIMIWRFPKFRGHIIFKTIVTLMIPFAALFVWSVIYFFTIIPIMNLIR